MQGDKFLKPGIGDAMIISLEGNEIEGWGKKIQAMNNLKSNYETLNDTVFNTQIENEKKGAPILQIFVWWVKFKYETRICGSGADVCTATCLSHFHFQ